MPLLLLLVVVVVLLFILALVLPKGQRRGVRRALRGRLQVQEQRHHRRPRGANKPWFGSKTPLPFGCLFLQHPRRPRGPSYTQFSNQESLDGLSCNI